MKRKIRCYHNNYTDEYLSSLSLEGLYANLHPHERFMLYSEVKKYAPVILKKDTYKFAEKN